MTNTSTKRVRYFYVPESPERIEMIWAIDPNKDQASWWGLHGWVASTVTNGLLKYFKDMDHMEPVSLYQIRALGVQPYKPS